MKVFAIVLSFLTISIIAKAADYDELLSKQTTIEVTGISKPGRAIGGSAIQVCASLGYPRVVSSKSEPCTPGELIFFRNAEAASVSNLTTNADGDLVCGKMGIYTRLVSVICAK